jgi:uncharacterized protein YpmB
MKIKNQKKFLIIGIFILILILFISVTCCITGEKINRDEAIHIALNDPRTIQAINNSAFNVSDVSTASFGHGMESQKEVYYISIKVLDGSDKRVIVFVTYDGTVALVDTPYPRITPSDHTVNDSVGPGSGQIATV